MATKDKGSSSMKKRSHTGVAAIGLVAALMSTQTLAQAPRPGTKPQPADPNAQFAGLRNTAQAREQAAAFACQGADGRDAPQRTQLEPMIEDQYWRMVAHIDVFGGSNWGQPFGFFRYRQTGIGPGDRRNQGGSWLRIL
jgi:hypothetical protein